MKFQQLETLEPWCASSPGSTHRLRSQTFFPALLPTRSQMFAYCRGFCSERCTPARERCQSRSLVQIKWPNTFTSFWPVSLTSQRFHLHPKKASIYCVYSNIERSYDVFHIPIFLQNISRSNVICKKIPWSIFVCECFFVNFARFWWSIISAWVGCFLVWWQWWQRACWTIKTKSFIWFVLKFFF